MMRCFGLCLVLLAPALQTALGQDEAGVQLPTITLSLPPEVSSAAAQINYFMTGPFGGYGQLVRLQNGATTYEIAASVNGKPASDVKVVAYIPGCEIETIEVKVLPSASTQYLTCKPIEKITLRGQISPESIPQDQTVTVAVDYLALWAQEFFGTNDGMVMSLHVGTVTPAKDGSFEVEVPDFSNQSNLGEAAFQLTLRQAKGGNIIGSLKTSGEAGNAYGLEVRHDYPETIQFTRAIH